MGSLQFPLLVLLALPEAQDDKLIPRDPITNCYAISNTDESINFSSISRYILSVRLYGVRACVRACVCVCARAR